MTDELGSSARALLDAAREGMSPDTAAIQRMRAKIDVTVATGTAGGAAAGSTLGAKLGLLALVGTIVLGGYLYATRERPAPRSAVKVTAPAPSVTPAPAPDVATPVAVVAPIDTPAPLRPAIKIKPAVKPAPSESPDIVLAPDQMKPANPLGRVGADSPQGRTSDML